MLKTSITSVVIILTAVTLVAVGGSRFMPGNDEWYQSIRNPSWQPPGWVFGVVWTTLFILAAISIILIWNTRPHNGLTNWFVAIAIINGVLNILWSAIFFGNKLIYPAIWEAGVLCLSVVAMVFLGWSISRVGAVLLIPYAFWTAFATYLTRTIYVLNK